MVGLDSFIELLNDLPTEANGGFNHAHKHAQQMADQLRGIKATNPLMNEQHGGLDPSQLFGLNNPSVKTRISVINFVGLLSLESQQEFLNQLAMTLFTWIKKYPASPDQPLRGLLVIDEAKDFVPSMRSTPCKESLVRLAAQARKYGLGLIFATQTPKSVDSGIIGNCSTQFYGQANAPAAIETIEEMIRQKGGEPRQDIARLGTGNFYFHSEKINGEVLAQPIKIKSPFCLSHHPNAPLDEAEILHRAQQSKQNLNPH
jgi:hypothetical protein